MRRHLYLAPDLADLPSSQRTTGPIRVVLAEDHAAMRYSLRRLLENEAECPPTSTAVSSSSPVRNDLPAGRGMVYSAFTALAAQVRA